MTPEQAQAIRDKKAVYDANLPGREAAKAAKQAALAAAFASKRLMVEEAVKEVNANFALDGIELAIKFAQPTSMDIELIEGAASLSAKPHLSLSGYAQAEPFELIVSPYVPARFIAPSSVPLDDFDAAFLDRVLLQFLEASVGVPTPLT